MSTHKHIDRICCIVLAFTLILAALFMCAEALGVEASVRPLGYEDRLFSTDKVHTIDIIIDDWDAFISTATSEEYSVCSVVIDGEAVKSVGIRGKGNTSLSSVSSMDSERYSFKIEFDQYDSTKSYYGLDKLSLNNIIQDNTYMKDYLAYQMMNAFGVSAPLCSYVYITVNGEDWGLYLAVEGVEDAFLRRNYGSDYGELYKPDSMSFGGGRGNGDDFDFSALMGEGGGFESFFGEGMTIPDMGDMNWSDRSSETGKTPAREDTDGIDSSERFNLEDFTNQGGFGAMGGFGMGSSDVKLQYIDDNASSYSNIFNNAKTDITEADQNRLIASLKQLSEYENVDEVVDVDAVLRYFVVHNYVVNGDSYTGSMIHNYYLYEEDGQLSMIPWDYNLAYGTFQGSNASSSVNESIDEVLSDRPMQAWIFSDEEYSAQYYVLYEEFLASVDAQAIIDKAYSIIAPYVEKDPTAFCTYDEFESGVEALKTFCALRSESVALQLSGSEESVAADGLNISDMGMMGGSFGGERDFSGFGQNGGAENIPNFGNGFSGEDARGTFPMQSDSTEESGGQAQNPWGSGGMPNMGDFDISNIPEDMTQFPSGAQNGQRPDGNSQGTSIGSASIGSASNGFAISNDVIMLFVSAMVLAAGLVFAAIFKRRR